MGRIVLAQIFAFLLFGSELFSAVVQIEYYFQAGCEECRRVNAFVLPQLEEEFAGTYELHRYDIGIEENYRKLAALQEKMGVSDNSPACMILNDHHYLGGYRVIESSLAGAMESALLESEPQAARTTGDDGVIRRRGETFTAGAIILAGLVDGINPCVFATLIFFISMLGVAKRKGQALFLAGAVYCTACFLAYLALGFGLFRFLRVLAGFHRVQNGIEWGLIAVLLVFAFLSFRDAARYRRSGSPKDVTLQLPESIKRRIHRTMRNGLKYRYLLPGIFLVGILVTMLESVCSGQVYVPTLVLLSKEFGAGSRWFGFLLLYNFMFILPLLFIFLAAWHGATMPTLLNWSKANVVWSKNTLGCFFLLLAGLMAFLNYHGGVS